MFKFQQFFLLITFGLLTSCGGGGGGGSSGASGACNTAGCTVGGVYTTEYTNQNSLHLIGAQAANDAGYTGDGIKVAVVDSGVLGSHAEFDQTSQVGRNFTSDGTAFTDIYSHGTHVASIIAAERDGSGMRGVAYNADIYSYKIFDDDGVSTGISTDSKWATMIDYHTTDGIKISNNSWGSTQYDTDDLTTSTITLNIPLAVAAYKAAVANGTIFVFSAGNAGWAETNYQAGLPYRISDIEDGWLAVMAVDVNLKETDYTNRCGLAADWCVTAPGGGDASGSGIYAGIGNGGYAKYSGTSMAAPMVSGLLATVYERFSSSLTSAQIRNRVLTTATYAGLKRSDGELATNLSQSAREAIFGKGLVTYGAATNSIGSLNFVTGNNYNTGNSHDISLSKINLPIGVSSQALMNNEFMVFDSFDGADFKVKGKEIFTTALSSNKIGYSQSNSKGSDPYIIQQKFSNIKDKNSSFVDNFSFSSFIQSNKISEISSATIWGDKSSFVSQANFIDLKDISQFEMELSSNKDYYLSAFIQSLTSNNKIKPEGFGLNFSKKLFDDRLSLKTSLAQQNDIPINLTFASGSSQSPSNMETLDYGFEFELNDTLGFFLRNTDAKISNTSAGIGTLGLNSTSMSSKNIGMEYNDDKSYKIAFGLYQAQHLSSGSLEILSNTGKDADGVMYYEKTSFANDHKPDFAKYVAAEIGLKENIILSLSMQESGYNSGSLDRGDISLSLNF